MEMNPYAAPSSNGYIIIMLLDNAVGRDNAGNPQASLLKMSDTDVSPI